MQRRDDGLQVLHQAGFRDLYLQQARLDASGNMIDDFKIEYSGNAIHVLNAPSPAATASLAIGTAVMEMAEKHFQIH